MELQRHGISEQEARNQAAISFAREFHLPLLATNGVSMATEFEREILDVLTSIRHGCSLDDSGLLLQQNGKRHLRSADEMCTLFRDVAGAIAATAELSDRLSFQMKEMGYEFPRYPIPEGETMDSFLRKRTFEGVARRYGAKAIAKLRASADKQVNTELALIAKLGLAGYFLIVWDIVEFCRRHGIFVQGRGSAANSAVCYSLGITAVDPVGMSCCSSASSPKCVASGRTSISICLPVTIASVPSSTFTADRGRSSERRQGDPHPREAHRGTRHHRRCHGVP